MRITHTYFMTLMAGGAAAAVLGAPISMAAPMPLKDCVVTGVASTCQSPGNVEITDLQPAVNFHPYGAMPFLIGGH
jgi:hypothetical protein